MRFGFIPAVVMLAALPALADEAAPPPAKASQPCQRGETAVHMAGVDLDDMRCHYAVAMQQLAATALEVVDRDARLRMTASDLAASQAREKALGDELAKLRAAAKPDGQAKSDASKP